MRGPNFWQLHELFDKIAEAVEGPIDEVAERIATLGGLPRRTVRMAAKDSPLAEFPEKFDEFGHVGALIERMAAAANIVRAQVDESEELGDKDTFLEAHSRKEG